MVKHSENIESKPIEPTSAEKPTTKPIKSPKITTSNITRILFEMNSRMKKLSKSQAITTDEMQQLSSKAWKIQQVYEKKMTLMDLEKKQLQNQYTLMWNQLSNVLFPVMEVEGELLPIYKELVDILNSLMVVDEHFELFIDDDARSSALVLLQDRIHKVESKKINGIFGIHCNSDNVPSGQAICNSLLFKCYKIIRKIQLKPNETAAAPESRISELNHTLTELLSFLKAGFDFDSSFLSVLIDEAALIEKHKKNNIFIEDDGTIAPNQELLHKQLDLTHDLINECILSYEEYPSNEEKLNQVASDLNQARNEILMNFDFIGDDFDVDYKIADLVYDDIVMPISKTLQLLENQSIAITEKTGKFLYSMMQSALGFASRLSMKRESIDEDGKLIHDKLIQIISDLKSSRNKINYRILKGENDKSLVAEAKDMLEEKIKQLAVIENEMVNGKFVDAKGNEVKGQDALRSLYDQAQALLKSF